MKSIISPLLLIAMLFTACHGKRPKTPASIPGDSTAQSKSEATSLASLSDEMQKKVEELKKLSPLTDDQVMAMLPEQLIGFVRSDLSANNSMGFAGSEARYKDSATGMNLVVSVIDCAGEAGAGEYSIAYWMRLNTPTETDDGYTKSVDFNGQKAVEAYDKDNDVYSLTYIASKRLLVNIKGERTGLDAVKLSARSLKFR